MECSNSESHPVIHTFLIRFTAHESADTTTKIHARCMIRHTGFFLKRMGEHVFDTPNHRDDFDIFDDFIIMSQDLMLEPDRRKSRRQTYQHQLL